MVFGMVGAATLFWSLLVQDEMQMALWQQNTIARQLYMVNVTFTDDEDLAGNAHADVHDTD